MVKPMMPQKGGMKRKQPKLVLDDDISGFVEGKAERRKENKAVEKAKEEVREMIERAIAIGAEQAGFGFVKRSGNGFDFEGGSFTITITLDKKKGG